MEREVGGGIRMGNTCKPMAVSFQCMTKFTTNKKKERKKKKLKKINKSIFSRYSHKCFVQIYPCHYLSSICWQSSVVYSLSTIN